MKTKNLKRRRPSMVCMSRHGELKMRVRKEYTDLNNQLAESVTLQEAVPVMAALIGMPETATRRPVTFNQKSGEPETFRWFADKDSARESLYIYMHPSFTPSYKLGGEFKRVLKHVMRSKSSVLCEWEGRQYMLSIFDSMDQDDRMVAAGVRFERVQSMSEFMRLYSET